MNNHSKQNGVFSAFLIGAAIGATAAILSDGEKREKISKTFRGLKSNGENK